MITVIKKEVLPRNSVYDFMRFIGIICIVLAHMNIPNLLAQIRNFDVPFLVILSGIAYTEFSALHHTSYLEYVKKRFYRLIVPTWIFLTIYFFSFYTYDQINIKILILSYSLLGHNDLGVGVWIIRIFFSMALLAPLFFWWNKKLDTHKKFYFFILVTFMIYTLIHSVSQDCLTGKYLIVFNLIFMYTISYGLLYLYGIRLNSFNQRSLKLHFIFIAIIFASYIAFFLIQFNQIYPTQKFKYPPEGYYLSYAILISIVLFYLSKFTEIFTNISKNKLIVFVGSSTVWIYLWHWYFLKLYNLYNFDLHYIVKFLVIFLFTVLTVYVQNRTLFYVLHKFSFSKKTKKTLTTVFIG